MLMAVFYSEIYSTEKLVVAPVVVKRPEQKGLPKIKKKCVYFKYILFGRGQEMKICVSVQILVNHIQTKKILRQATCLL